VRGAQDARSSSPTWAYNECMSRLLAFYRGGAPDSEGRLLADILAWSDERLEEVHDFIQWLFPLPEPSCYNPNAPLLTPEDIAAFKTEPVLRENFQRSFERILAFFGLILFEGVVIEGPNFDARVSDVWESPNHNWLRITRVLRSSWLLGKQKEALAFFERLEALYRERLFPIGADTFEFWKNAVRS
jgi:hypothetical protein